VALEQLEARYSPENYSAYRPFLLDTGKDGYSEAAEAHGISASAFKVGVHRIRKRFREELERTISATIDETDDLNQEMSYLLEVLSHCNLDGRYAAKS
jgi:RNA polymerase sigma-70 factor (ECF subfamily)